MSTDSFNEIFSYHRPDEHGLIPNITIRGNYHTAVDHCRGCYHAWKGKRRLLGHGLDTVCELCERREREGLVRYQPSNGTEMDIFQSRCRVCRHCSENPDGYDSCAWGILDRIYEAAGEDHDTAKLWFHPDDLQTKANDGRPLCPAVCLRFTDRSDPNGEFRDPPPPHDPNQLTFEDLLEVRENAPQREGVAQ